MTSMLSSQGNCASWGQETGGCLSGSWCSQALNRCQGKLSGAFPPPLASRILKKGGELSISRAVCADKAGPTATKFRLQKRLHTSFLWNIPTAAARQEPGVQGEGCGCGRGSRPQKQMACLAPSPERRGHPGNHLEPEIKKPEALSFSE